MPNTLESNPKIRELQRKLFGGEQIEQEPLDEPQDSFETYSDHLLKQIHGDKVRHHFTCPKHGSYSIWIPPEGNPEDYPHPCPVCEHEKEQENARRSEICDRFRRRASTAESFLNECGVRRTDYHTFDEYMPETVEQTAAKNVCMRFAEGFMQRIFEKRADIGIWMSGPFGSGKTHLATAILTVLQKRGVPGVIVKTADLVDALNSDPSKVSKRIGALSEVSCLVLDDFGATTLTDSEQKRIYQIVDARIQAHLPTIYTTNLSFEEFQATYNGRLVSRVVGVSYEMGIVGKDHRKKKISVKDMLG